MKLPVLRGTLFIRLAALVVMAVLASQVFTLWLGVKQKNSLLAGQLYAQVVDTLADYEGALARLPEGQRSPFLLANNQAARAGAGPALLAGDAADALLAAVLAANLAGCRPGGFAIAIGRFCAGVAHDPAPVAAGSGCP